MKSSLIRMRIGDKVSYDSAGRGFIPVKILDMVLTPNGMTNPKLVCLIFAETEDGRHISATSDKFFPLDSEEYPEFYPSVHLCHLSD
jgi:hypothetical protein